MTTLGGTTLGGGGPAKKAAAKKKPAGGRGAGGGAPAAAAAGTALGGAAAAPAATTEAAATTPATPTQAATPAPTTTAPLAATGTALGGGGTALGGTALGGGGPAKKAKKAAPPPAAAAPAAAAAASGGTALGGAPATTETDGGGDGTAQGLSAAAKKKNKKKKKAAAPATGVTPAELLPDPAPKPDPKEKGNAAARNKMKAVAARILKEKEEQRLREEEEKRRIEEEERKAEEERIAAEKRAIEDAAKRAIKKEEQKKRREENAKIEAEKRRQEHLKRLGIKAPVKGQPGQAPKKQSQMYNAPKKAKPANTASTTASDNTQSATDGQDQQKDDEDDWERNALVAPGEDESKLQDGDSNGSAAASSDDTNTTNKKEAPSDPTNKDALDGIEEAPAATDTTSSASPATGDKKQRDLRSPICCVLGHVDTGKTKLLDKIRRTNVQGGEAGGITQQIGATYFPLEVLQAATRELLEGGKFSIRVPGLLIIDTPGHESFTNLRSRGSSLCDIAILVVDIMHGLEQQTIESIKLLRMRKTPFIVALNKIDRLFGWKTTAGAPFQSTFAKQQASVKQEFENRVQETIVNFAEQELNAELYYKNKDMNTYVSLVPTSAVTGEGIPDLLTLLLKLTQTRLSAKITTLSSFQATVLEVKVVEGLGTTIDVILSNGVLHEGDRIVMAGLGGPIVTNIRALLTPHPCKEIRVKTPYIRHKEVKAAQGVKISAQGLEKAVAGSTLVVVNPGDDEERIMSHIQSDLTDLFSKVSKRGVLVQASTLGSLEALLTFLKSSEIPVSAVNLGPVHRSDVIKASVNVGEDETRGKKKEYGTILAFDVKVTREAREEAAKAGVKIFTADIIYHLFDQFTAYVAEIKAQQRVSALEKLVYPCALEILPDCIFMQKDPILIGVRVKEGSLKMGTPLCVLKVNEDDKKKEVKFLGRVTGIEENRRVQQEADVDAEVAVKIEGGNVLYGRHFDYKDEVFALITRESIDLMKEYFREELKDKDMLRLIKKLKERLDIL
eukprot:TRINITY_DN3218_c0_g3_i2.p1 TRINITY_DN3218_c0_g3~~TRINITY_DN3218_c0_g3_i2.p1  ORF type:complete len:1025 (+),score=321.57 TRINITY_DN3218_c0_g3_i2:35-3076(+)